MTGDVPPDPTLALEKQRARDEADAAERANAVDERVELPPDTIAPMPEWMYPRNLDSIPALFGRLNPLTGVLVYYTGAVLRECTAGNPRWRCSGCCSCFSHPARRSRSLVSFGTNPWGREN